MRWTSLLAASMAAVPTLVQAHDGLPLPKLVGRRSVSDLKARNAFGGVNQKRAAAPQPAPQPVAGPKLEARQNTAGQCGAGFGSCAAGYCCSPAGWCGLTEDFCAAPYAQFNYGSGADTLQIPPGPKTSNVARTKLGSVPYGGVGIDDCTEPGVIALTFDDGPYIYTSQVLDVLAKYNATATFFITGNNNGKGQIGNVNTGYPAIIQRMHAAGHQIGSHTWGHQDLGANAAAQTMDQVTRAQRLNQMYYNEIALNDILGFFPTYMRPPFSDCDSASGCEADMATLGYHVVYFDLDTEDYLLDDPNLIQQAKNDFLGNITSQNAADGADWLVIAHDIHEQTAYNLTEYMLITLLQYGYKPVTLGECLGDPAANWYRTLGGGAPYTSAVSSTASVTSSTTSTSSTSTKTTSTSTSTKTTSTSSKTTSTSTMTTSTSTKTTSTSTKTTTTTKSTSTTSTKTTTTTKSTTTTSGAAPTSTDGTCGTNGGHTCQGSTFGNCCSPAGWCGSTSAYCSVAGCQTAFGTCSASTGTISPDATCGGTNGYTCTGSAFGTCCSVNGWCGTTSAYCGTGCQAAYGSGCT